MTALFALLDVDYRQWKAVSRTLLRSDFRLPFNTGGRSFGRFGDLIGLVLFHALFGLGAAAIVFWNRDVLLTGTIALTYLGVMLSTSLLTHHGTTLLSTADYVILGPRPVSSRTFFAIRVTNVLFHALLLTSLMAYPVAIAFAIVHHGSLGTAAAALVAIYAWMLTVSLVLVASYSTLLQVVGASRFQRAVGYLQLAGGFFAYGGLMLTSSVMGGRTLVDARLPDKWWVLALPPTWFASYIEVASGVANSTTAARMAISVAVLFALAAAVRGKLGLNYAASLAELPTTAGTSGTPSVRTPLFKSGEARAVALLAVAHFRHDLRVRMGILAIVPVIVLYAAIGVRNASFDLVAMAVLLFPAVVLQHLASTDSHAASWIYWVTPVDRGRLVVVLKNIAVVYFLMPFLVFAAGVFMWRSNDTAAALVHTVMLGALGHIALQISIVIGPRLPFALPPDKVRGNVALIGWMFVVIIGGQAAVFALDRWIYVTASRTAMLLTLMMATSWALNRAIGWRARSMAR